MGWPAALTDWPARNQASDFSPFRLNARSFAVEDGRVERTIRRLERASASHFVSLLGSRPNNRITGSKVMSSKTKPSANRAAAALRLAANALHRSDSALGVFLRRKKAHIV